MDSEIIYRTRAGYIEKKGDSFSVYANAMTDYDGIKATDLRLIKTYAEHYIINHTTSKVTSVYWKFDPLAAAIEELSHYAR